MPGGEESQEEGGGRNSDRVPDLSGEQSTDDESETEQESEEEEVLDLSREEPAPPPGPAPAPAVGPEWNPEPARERIRGAIAVGLVGLLALIATGSFVLLATGTLSLEETEGLLTALFTPLLALAGTALGFYFGGQRRN
ncbi:MAG: hypothetical protein ACREXY_12035 [Gammaproteobacteria bacterium]